jgi:hypothetical protein
MSQQPPLPPRQTQYQPQTPAGNGLAITSLVLGIIGCVIFCVPFVPWLLGITAIILGAVAISQAGPVGNGKAKAGLILGVLALALGIGFWMALRAGVSVFHKKVQENSATWQKELEDAAKRAEEAQKKAEQEIEKQKQNQNPATQPGSMRMDRFELGPVIFPHPRSAVS